jgi:hypothetical protein
MAAARFFAPGDFRAVMALAQSFSRRFRTIS